MLRLVANIAGWFAVSIFLTLYNKLSVTAWGMDFPLTIACQHGRSALLAVPHLAPCATSGRSWRLWAARYTPRKRPALWAASHRLGCSSEPPPKPLISPPLTIQACVHLIMRAPMAVVAMRYMGVRAVRFSWRELCVSYFPVSALIAPRSVENKARQGPAQGPPRSGQPARLIVRGDPKLRAACGTVRLCSGADRSLRSASWPNAQPASFAHPRRSTSASRTWPSCS